MTDSERRTGERLRVLVIAELCNPDWVSVPLEGWGHSRALAEMADLHLVTNVMNRENILKAGLEEGKDFTAIDPSAVAGPMEGVAKLLGADAKKSVGWTTLAAVGSFSYYWFEHQVWQLFESRLRAGEFDLVHRLTPCSPVMPSLLAARCEKIGVPFLLGPLNGGIPWPKGFHKERLREREFLSYVRGVYRLLPGYRSTRAKARAIIAGSLETRRQIAARWRGKTVYVPENGIDPTRFDRHVSGPVTLPLRVVFVGRLVPYKCPDLLLKAAAPLMREGKVTVDVIGDGPLMPDLRAIAERERLGDAVTFAGWVDHRELKERLVRARVFGFPSVREFGGAVVLEAMATGLVPIVIDYGGPAELVSPRTGFTVPLGSRAEIEARFRRVLEDLVADPSGLETMGERARRRAFRQFTWKAKAAQTYEVYRWVLGRRDQPDFGTPLPDLQDDATAGAPRASV